MKTAVIILTALTTVAFAEEQVSQLPRPVAEEPTPAEKKAEEAARSAQIAKDLKAAQARLTRLPTKEQAEQVRARVAGMLARLKEDKKSYPREDVTQPLYVAEAKTCFTSRGLQEPEKMGFRGGGEGYIQASRYFRTRGTDVIVVVMPNHVQTYGHTMAEGLSPDVELCPRFTKQVIHLMEEGVEVLDLRDAFSRHPRSEPTVLIPRDHHWSLEGRKLAAKLLGERLQRYAFVRRAAPGKQHYGWASAYSKAWKKDLPILTYSGPDQDTWRLAAALGWGAGFTKTNGGGDQNQLAMYTPITVLGDSQVGMFGDAQTGIYQLVGMETGMVVGFWGGRNSPAPTAIGQYRRVLPLLRSEPRVLILVNTGMGFGSFRAPDEVKKIDKSNEYMGSLGRMLLRAEQVTVLPADVTRRAYKDAYRTIMAEVMTGILKGQHVQLIEKVMENHVLLPDPLKGRDKKTGKMIYRKIKKGDFISATIVSWTKAKQKDPKLAGVMLLDDTDLFDCPRYLATEVKHSWDHRTDLKRLPVPK